MKDFLTHSFSLTDYQDEVVAFENLLAENIELSEQDQILPFFKKNRNLAAEVSLYVPFLQNPDLIAYEYDLYGDFICDLVVGDSTSKTYALIEFEDAKKESLFARKGTKATPEWSPRLEHGYSQIVDWFWKLNDMKDSADFEGRFGSRKATMHGLLIVGRDHALQKREQDRLAWRQDYCIVDSRKISIITFDRLLKDMKHRADILAALSISQNTGKAKN